MTRIAAALVICLVLAKPTTVPARDGPPPLTLSDLGDAATYSVVCASANTGDLAGVRVFVSLPGSPARVVVQVAEGDLGELVIARTWTRAGRLHFAAAATPASPALSGQVRAGAVRLDAAYGDFPRVLPLRDDRGGFPICD